MKSLKELFILGPGPSSSHTIGPYRACLDFLNIINTKNIDEIEVTLFQSLAFTGKGHLTDKIIINTLNDYKVKVIFDIETKVVHPNTLLFKAIKNNTTLIEEIYYSIGGGAILKNSETIKDIKEVYPFNTFKELKKLMKKENTNDIFDIIKKYEGNDILDYITPLIEETFNTIKKGIKTEGTLPGKLNLKRVASSIYKKATETENIEEKTILLLSSFAYSLAESNALGELILTTPTCGSCGVLPGLMYYFYKYKNYSLEEISKAFLVGGLIGNFIKKNATISGACGGCQAEIGAASTMGSGAVSYLNKLSIDQIEYASEVSMEHFLGLTCDPVGGYVQIPCIERNGIAIIHAYTAYIYAKYISPSRKNFISLDEVISTMNETGHCIVKELKETSLGGLAQIKKGCL